MQPQNQPPPLTKSPFMDEARQNENQKNQFNEDWMEIHHQMDKEYQT
jgi:hypothetical protein